MSASGLSLPVRSVVHDHLCLCLLLHLFQCLQVLIHAPKIAAEQASERAPSAIERYVHTITWVKNKLPSPVPELYKVVHVTYPFERVTSAKYVLV
jgi:hypothetical protein